MAANIVSTENLVFDYPAKRALFGIDLAVKEGGITALVGPNGAGKTTLIRCLVGLATPSAGKVMFAGIDVALAPRAAHRDMGYLPDFYGLYEELSVRALLEHGAEMRGIDRADARRRAVETAEQLDIKDRLDDKVSSLSRGLAQRAAIARAIIHTPKFLVLDEPAAGLDQDARVRLSALFRRLRDGGMTLLISSHILAELEDYCSDMIIIQDGRVVDIDTSEGRPVTVEIELAGPDPRLVAVLEAFAGIGPVVAYDRTARVDIVATNDARAQLLRHLVDAGLEVVRFAEREERLQDTYHRAVTHGKIGGKIDGDPR
jgi:ABC-2 type transport system ATP-binding protein